MQFPAPTGPSARQALSSVHSLPNLRGQTYRQPSGKGSEARGPHLPISLSSLWPTGVHRGPCSALGRTQEASPQALEAFQDFYPTVGLPADMVAMLPKSGTPESPAPAKAPPGQSPAPARAPLRPHSGVLGGAGRR